MPLALRGANWMSVISALAASSGFTSPNARAVIFSYAPTLPKVIPPNVGDSRRMTWSDVMRASASGGIKTAPAARTRASASAFMRASPGQSVLSNTRFSGAGPNEAQGTTCVCATPFLLQSHTPSRKMLLSRANSASVKETA